MLHTVIYILTYTRTEIVICHTFLRKDVINPQCQFDVIDVYWYSCYADLELNISD